MTRFVNKTVLIIGASGGLGQAFARAFAAEGATVLLTARRPDTITAFAHDIGADTVVPLDITSPTEIAVLADRLADEYPTLSIVVNATGYDVRKPFSAHTAAEIADSLNVNLQGAMLITQAFLPALQRRGDSFIVHLGGFADGRLAFPFYAADFASRAGLRGFVDALNREIKGSGVTIGYFSPSPANTVAEKPFHELWKQMGQAIVPTEAVAQALLDASARKQAIYVMGGWLTRLFAHVNGLWPTFADALMMNTYRTKLAEFFQFSLPTPVKRQPQSPIALWLGIGLAILSFVLYGIGLFIIPFLALETTSKAIAIPALFAVGEITFWAGVALAGKEVITRYRRYLNPCNWRRKPTV